MCEVKKMLFSVSAQGNPLAQIWVDEADITKNSEAIYIALKNQVAYFFFSGVGSKITLKKSKQYYNVEVPDNFTNLFEGYKVSDNPTIKMIGAMLNQAFNNCFNSIEFLKNGEVVKISQEEANEKCREYMNGYNSLYSVVLESLGNSKIKALKSVSKILEKEDSKAGDIKEAHSIVSQFTTLLSREVIAKNNFVIDNPIVEEVKKTEEVPADDSEKATKAKAGRKKKADVETISEDEIPF